LGGGLATREISGIVNDPVDEAAESSLIDGVKAALDEANRSSEIEKGRAVDWEPWFEAMVPMTVDEVMGGGVIAHLDLIRAYGERALSGAP
jgi:hypothetical protein